MHVFLIFIKDSPHFLCTFSLFLISFIIARGHAIFSRAAIIIAIEGSAKHVAWHVRDNISDITSSNSP
jgi:hypothetical protein